MDVKAVNRWSEKLVMVMNLDEGVRRAVFIPEISATGK